MKEISRAKSIWHEETDDERDRAKFYMPEVYQGGVPTRTRQQQCVTQLEHGEHDDSQRCRHQRAC